MNGLTEYITDFVNVPLGMRKCRVWHEEEEEMVYKNLFEITEEDSKRMLMLPIGLEDCNKVEIYTGDVVEVEIDTKRGKAVRHGIVRREGFYCCGIDYLDKNGVIGGDGDYIDEFYLSNIEVIGHIFGMEGSEDE